MKTRPNKNIKKLSTAIRRGYKICKENGIGVSRQVMFDENKEGLIIRACALGMANIGKYGLTTVDNQDYGIAKGYSEPLGEIVKNYGMLEWDKGYVKPTVIYLNDKAKKNPDEIADILEKCGL